MLAAFPTVKLDKLYESSFTCVAVLSATLPREPMSSSITGRLPSLEELESYALEQWEAYNLSTLTDVQRNAIKDLASLGLVKLQQGRKESWFIPTKLATTPSVSLSDKSARKQGYVVVETNFKIYAYSTSKLHYEILRLFSRIEYRLPNLIAGSITKESVDNAFEKGITSEQIISYLQQNAHPRVAEKTTAVPENVTDMIRFWEADRNRVGITPCHPYEDFPSKDVFEAACDFARELDGLLWEDSKKTRLVVNEELHQDMQDFLRRQEVTTSKTSTSKLTPRPKF
ncbi:uncharacterized protein A4U43_C10F5700 [Asparagus officinalis]|uniref:RNA polymerase II transcription factor B subunit 2 n=1 Tax=Asparagus officinalis TaxID=4686 RepID=A0A5P1E104_ASPOF|nr:uncharacterized protein A4U43_C10F5700 [Asparagus officinalis]